MARRSLKPQLNQIRAWVRQGRTDAWIAHQLEVPVTQLRDFRRRHGLTADGEDPSEVDLRDEIEAEIEAAEQAATDQEDEQEADGGEDEKETAQKESGEGRERRRRRRRRRGGRRRSKAGIEATFDHGERDGYGLWLDPVVKDDPVYSEHWKGHRALRVTIEPERIVLERAEKD